MENIELVVNACKRPVVVHNGVAICRMLRYFLLPTTVLEPLSHSKQGHGTFPIKCLMHNTQGHGINQRGILAINRLFTRDKN